MADNKIYEPRLFLQGGLTPEDEAKLNHITITKDINIDTLEQDLTAVKDSITGISYDTASSTTSLAHNIKLENVQADMTDITTQGAELASTKRVEDMITAFGGSSMKIFNGLASINFQDSWIDPTQPEANAIKLLHDTAETDAKGQPWELLIDVKIATSPNLEKIFGSEGLLLISPIEDDYHKIEFYNHTKDKTAVGLYNDADGSYVDVKYIALESDITGATHYEGIASIDIPSDILFVGKTPQEVMTTLVEAARTKHGTNRWSFAQEIEATGTPTLHGIFGDGYIAISYVGNNHHVAHFYSDDEKIFVSTYDSTNTVRVDYQQYQLVGEYNYQIIEEDIAGNTPTRQECVLAYMKVIGFDWEKRMEFRIKSTAKDKFFAIEYLGQTGATQQNPSNFRIFDSTLA